MIGFAGRHLSHSVTPPRSGTSPLATHQGGQRRRGNRPGPRTNTREGRGGPGVPGAACHTPGLVEATAGLALGCKDSNLDYLDQNQACCQLHYTPSGTVWAEPVNVRLSLTAGLAAVPGFGPELRDPKARVLPVTPHRIGGMQAWRSAVGSDVPVQVDQGGREAHECLGPLHHALVLLDRFVTVVHQGVHGDLLRVLRC